MSFARPRVYNNNYNININDGINKRSYIISETESIKENLWELAGNPHEKLLLLEKEKKEYKLLKEMIIKARKSRKSINNGENSDYLNKIEEEDLSIIKRRIKKYNKRLIKLGILPLTNNDRII